MESLEALELAILEYKKDLEEDSNNQWVKNVLQGLKEVKQDLERFEKLEAKDKKWQELFGCDLCEVLGRELLREENEKLKQEYQELLVNKNVAQGIATKYKQKLKQIEALPNCDICDENWHKGCMCLQKKIKEVLGNE